ncbi:SDR family oxidoreductase [Mycetocola zhadangensis]|uniref:SDR family oxidoreductase n=1 Tax=Mycetocola zhadangensis TaxID=1164595 RepID=A0A3L7ISP6_9MICO|nr:SDR family oxidoreductase [Mycetocola zhadangensis]RLQ81256.1 SDR family oxidoreductase [Mycetocola zhadangensis]GGF03332.1 glucose-1-dehydrogenase [Mycetocola zhadangensis]
MDTEPGVRGVAVITGGSRGIGAATAIAAANAGWSVLLTYRKDERAGDEIVQTILMAGGRASSIRADMAHEDDITAIFEAADKLGTVTAFVANAGIAASQSRVDELTPSRIAELLAVNVAGPLLASGHAVRRMSTLHGGAGGGIVLVSSVASRLGAAGEYVDYAASKGAIDTLGVGLAREVAAEGIRVNVVRPGVIDTDIHGRNGRPDRAKELAHTIPMHRTGHAAEVAAAIIWLLSDEASYCTGSILDIAGGR